MRRVRVVINDDGMLVAIVKGLSPPATSVAGGNRVWVRSHVAALQVALAASTGCMSTAGNSTWDISTECTSD